MMLLHSLICVALLACVGAEEWTVVPHWNAIPHGDAKNISTLEGCETLCAQTEKCKQFTWNYGHKPDFYCFISTSSEWGGLPNDHITSGCLASEVKECGTKPTPPPPQPAPPPPPYTPKWTAIKPNKTAGPTFGYPLLAPDKVTHSYVYYGNHEYGTYNHGPMITFFDGLYYMQWYNGVKSESVENRVLYATSKNALNWTEPQVMFNTTGPIGLENEPAVIIQGRMYAVAGSWDVFRRTGSGAEHTGPNTPLMRQVNGPDSLGPVFWLGAVPEGFEHFGYPTANSTTLPMQTRDDAKAYLAALVNATPTSDAGKPNERAMYQLPSNPHRLMLLLRAGGPMPYGAPHGMLASSCDFDNVPPPPAGKQMMHFCRPITGIFNVGLPYDKMPEKTHPSALNDIATCNWSSPIGTSIPDSGSRACTAPLPDGRIFLIGAQIPTGRDPIVLSLSDDGLTFDKAWAVRVCVSADCEPRYGGPPGFQYPAAMWNLNTSEPEIIFSYSINKEDIGVSRFPLSVLNP
eukprot:m.61823 g.61823  ORF g.61823 m.61823 type:complete len:517 (+) comp11453_c0_seq1:136-1686(+)